MILLWLSTTVAIMAALVAWRFAQMAIREKRGSPARFLMLGIVCAAIGVLLIRVYWLPWHWANAQGMGLMERTGLLEHFWTPVGNYHLWGITVGMFVSAIGLHMHLNVVKTVTDHAKALAGLGTVMLIAGIAPVLAWWLA